GFFTEYYKDQAATDAAWQGGWFHTGDIVRRDADGDMFFVDRKKNVIRRSGENIMAVEVESTLMRHPAVVTAGVAGVSDVVRGEEVFACLVINGGAVEDRLRDIVRWCLTQIAYYKVPGFVASVAELPLTSTQKIQRSELKALVDRLVGDPATVDTTALKRRRSGS
ncbi:MAG: AMP-binding protein, partial [Arenicellales bacterium]|nr:AMP-binding protein [Arenicellales bacterium]